MKNKAPTNNAGSIPDPSRLPPGAIPIACEQIQELLFDYLTHDLGKSRAEMVHTHLMHCETCRTEATELHNTVKLLQQTPTPSPTTLARKRRRALMRAAFHPILHWMTKHHLLIAIIAGALAIIGFFIWEYCNRMNIDLPPLRTYNVKIGVGGTTATNAPPYTRDEQ